MLTNFPRTVVKESIMLYPPKNAPITFYGKYCMKSKNIQCFAHLKFTIKITGGFRIIQSKVDFFY